MSTTHPPLPAHLPSLDGIRGIAILMVLVHTTNILRTPSNLPAHALMVAAETGWMGVQLFFVLSGFLITRNLLYMRGTTGYFHSFYGRRVLRIFPLYYATLLFFFALLPWLGLQPPEVHADAAHQIGYWLFLSNWSEQLGLGSLSSLPHFWSLAVEEQFYLLWPLVVYVCPPKWLLRVCAAVAVTGLAMRCGIVWGGTLPIQIYTSSLCRMDALALGAGLAVVVQSAGAMDALLQRRRLLWATAAGLVLAGKLFPHGFDMLSPMGQTLGYTLIAAVCVVFLALALAGDVLQTGKLRHLLNHAVLKSVGKYSYAMYVVHEPLNAYVGHRALTQWGWMAAPTSWQGVVYVLGICLASYGLAWFCYLLIEKQFLRFKPLFAVNTTCQKYADA